MRMTTWAVYLGILIAAVPAFAATQTDIPGPAGSGAFGTSVTVLPNGNFVVTDPTYSIPAGAASVGAVYLYDGATLSIISTLTGSTANDSVGNGGITVLTNGNFVVSSSSWNNGAATSAGAATWGSATAGVNGAVTASNSLIGGSSNDSIGSAGGITALSNGNFVVNSSNWTNPVGPVSTVGAVTWCNGNGGTVGLVSVSNSLAGGTTNDAVGIGGVKALTNGNYVVASTSWTNPAGSLSNAGAATWGNGSGGTVGLVTSSNSLVGGTANDQVGSLVKALTNGNYVVASVNLTNPTGPTAYAGAATWGNGTGGTVGLVTSSNSLIGGTSGDYVGQGGVTALTNGNYVVGSYNWNNPTGPVAKVGAATWCNGTGGTVGLITPSNSLVGGTANDSVSLYSGVTALTNGNYVVTSGVWNNPAGPVSQVGAATWGNGNGGTVGLVSAANSLIGGMANDYVGERGATALTNGNYVVVSDSWTNPTGPAQYAGAVTWGNGSSGTVGLVSASNSLIGGTTNDSIGGNDVTPLANGNYVVASQSWTNPAGPFSSAGAATWGNGMGGTVGLVSPINSLVGGTANDIVGGGRVKALTNGNYVVRSQNWTNPIGPVSKAGAVTWGSGTGGTAGLVTASNSLTGGTANDGVGASGVTPLTNGHYVVQNGNWDNPMGPIVNADAASFGFGNGDTVGLITSANSVLGTAPSGISGFSFDYFRNRLLVGRAASNIVTIFVPSIVHHFNVSAPAAASSGIAFQVTVTAQNFDNTTFTSFKGTVHFTSTDTAASLPVDYTFTAGDNGVHTFNVTLNTPGTKTLAATDTITTTATGTSASIQVSVVPLAFASAPSAQPNPAGVGQPVTFMAAATGGVGMLTYSWNFGDSSPVASGAGVTHAYTAAGSFTATVTVTDTVAASVSSSMLVTVNAAVVGTGPDSDGDGFSDSFETAAGTLPNDATSTPTGMPATAGGVQPLTITKASIKLNFAKPVGNDTVSFSGTVAVPAGFTANGSKTFFVVGGVAKTISLTSKGSGVSGTDSIKVTLKSKKSVVQANPAAKYSVNFKKGTFAATLIGAGLTNANAKDAPVMVPFTLIFNNIVYQKTQAMSYTATMGKTGMAK